MTEPQRKTDLLHYKFSGSTGAIVGILMLALVALGERILYDLARTMVGETYDYFDNLPTIMAHALFIIPLLIISIVLNLIVGEKKEKYAIVLIPYFVFSIVLALQLSLQIAVYFANHHTQIQFYVVMGLLISIVTFAIYFIQDRYGPPTV